MTYVYFLFSEKDKGLYIGCTRDLKRRFDEHSKHKVTATKNRTPLALVHYEAFLLSSDAKAREKYLNSGYGRQQMRSQLKQLFEKLRIY